MTADVPPLAPRPLPISAPVPVASAPPLEVFKPDLGSIDLPQSERGLPLSDEDALVVLSKRALWLPEAPDSRLLLVDEGRNGFDESDKRAGPNDLYVIRLARLVDAHRTTRGRTIVAADEGVAYRALFEVLYTLAVTDRFPVGLVVRSPITGSRRVIDISTPEAPEKVLASPPSGVQGLVLTAREGATPLLPVDGLGFTMIVGDFGAFVYARSQYWTRNCMMTGRRVAVERRDGELDLKAVTSCARSLKEMDGLAGLATTATVAANPEVPVADVVAAIGAMMFDGNVPLFSQLRLAAVTSLVGVEATP